MAIGVEFELPCAVSLQKAKIRGMRKSYVFRFSLYERKTKHTREIPLAQGHKNADIAARLVLSSKSEQATGGRSRRGDRARTRGEAGQVALRKCYNAAQTSSK